MTHNIDDFGLTAEQLEDKYEKKGAHPEYRVGDWIRAVNLDATLLGYWEFVYYQLIDEEEQLQADSPY